MGALYSILRNFLCCGEHKEEKIKCESNCLTDWNCCSDKSEIIKKNNRQLRSRTKSIYEYDSYKDLTDIDLSNS